MYILKISNMNKIIGFIVGAFVGAMLGAFISYCIVIASSEILSNVFSGEEQMIFAFVPLIIIPCCTIFSGVYGFKNT
jgi:hypothetical protein